MTENRKDTFSVDMPAAPLPRGFVVEKGMLYYEDPDDDNPKRIWISSHIEVVASSCDEFGGQWGIVLRFRDRLNQTKEWAMPKSMLSGNGQEYRAILLDKGADLNTSSKARALLTQYLQQCRPKVVKTSVSKSGWHGKNYVTAGKTYGPEAHRLVFQFREMSEPDFFACRGSLEQWQEQIGRYVQGNSRLMLAVCASLAGPLLTPLDVEGGGFHFYGKSSIGKSTALVVARSIWGGPSRQLQWRATDNALESEALRNNDCAMTIDELGESDDRTLSKSVYMLANGHSKARMNKDGSMRAKQTWRVMVISTGEESVERYMSRTGGHRAGHSVRMLDIPAQAQFGLFDDLHQFSGGRALADHLKAAAGEFYGTAGDRFLLALTRNRQQSIDQVRDWIEQFVELATDRQDSTQVARGAKRFALAFSAGALASRWGILPFDEATVLEGIERAFLDWKANRGGSDMEQSKAIRAIRLFLEKHGTDRFVDLSDKYPQPVRNRAGYKHRRDGEVTYYFLREVFHNEVCDGMDVNTVISALKATGLLRMETPGRNMMKIPKDDEDGRRPRCYAISADILPED